MTYSTVYCDPFVVFYVFVFNILTVYLLNSISKPQTTGKQIDHLLLVASTAKGKDDACCCDMCVCRFTSL
jgi:hypothetical protein